MSEDEFDDEGYGPDGLEPEPLDEHELQHVQQDLSDLAEFEATFRPEGYRGVAVWCPDCAEEHFYPWDMLRENLTALIETGETPVHEPAFAPEPERYIQWDYARGYIDALRDAGVAERLPLGTCGRCGLHLGDELTTANFCPRCGTTLAAQRLRKALEDADVDLGTIDSILRAAGFVSA